MKIEEIRKVLQTENTQEVNAKLSEGWTLVMKPVKIKSVDGSEVLSYVLGFKN